MSDISSAGTAGVAPGYGKTCRQDVLRGVDGPGRAGCRRTGTSSAGIQAQRSEEIPARRARLRRRVPRSITITRRPYLAALYSIMARKVPHPQSEIAFASERLRTMFCTARSSRTITSWSRIRRVLALWRKSVRAARTFRVRPGDFRLGFGAVRGPALAAGQAPLVAGQVPRPASQVPGAGDPLAAAGDREVVDPQVHADGAAGGGELLRVGYVDGEGDVPASARVTGHRHRRRVDRRRVHIGPGPGERQRRVHLGQEQRAVAVPEPGPGVLRGPPAIPGLEPRIPCALSEERSVRGLLVADRLLQRDGRHLVQQASSSVAFMAVR